MKKNFYFLVLLLSFLGLNNTSSAQHTMLLAFTGTSGAVPGAIPQGDQNLLAVGSYFYGMTQGGGSSGLGVVFKVKPDGTGYATLLDFTGISNGSRPNGSLYSDGTFLYGMTSTGGANDLGTIFKIMPDGTGYAKLMDFASTGTGSNPKGSLIAEGGFLYGVASGSIFKIKPDGTGFAILASPNAVGSLVSDGTYFYAMGTAGVAGEIFKIKHDGTGFTSLMSFVAATSGGYPMGSLIYDGTFLYGMTEGSTKNNGTVFKIKPDGTGYINLKTFGGIDGRNPRGSLLLDGTDLYGMTRDGGTKNYGTIFKVNTSGVSSTVFDFTGFPGSFPTGSLISDGTYLYGMTTGGGPLGATQGTIFRYQISTTGINENNLANDIAIYPNPTTSLLNIKVKEKSQITLVNTLGAIVKTETIKGLSTIDISDLNAGVYFVNITDGITSSHSSIVIQK